MVDSAFAPLESGPLALLGYVNPASNDTVTLSFKQSIGAPFLPALLAVMRVERVREPEMSRNSIRLRSCCDR
jgi:hypothetical protein